MAAPFSWGHIFELKKRWHASASAIVQRSFRLDLIDPILYRRCYQYMSMKKWLKKEPYEPEFAGPEWLESAFRLAKNKFGVAPVDLANRSFLTAETFMDVTGVVVEQAKPLAFKPRLIRGQA